MLTNLPDEYTASKVLELYRLRWQIEMKFKNLKSVLHLGEVKIGPVTDALISLVNKGKLLSREFVNKKLRAIEKRERVIRSFREGRR